MSTDVEMFYRLADEARRCAQTNTSMLPAAAKGLADVAERLISGAYMTSASTGLVETDRSGNPIPRRQ